MSDALVDALWYLGRGTGLAALVLFTAVVVAGVLVRRGESAPGLSRAAVAAADAVAFIGMPEGRIPLAESTVYLATTAKSNAAYNAINAAIADVRAGGFGRVPMHLRDAHYPGAKRLGHGRGYKYAHDSEIGIVAQQYLPDELRGRRYYEPTNHGAERDVSARLEKIRRILDGQ